MVEVYKPKTLQNLQAHVYIGGGGYGDLQGGLVLFLIGLVELAYQTEN